MVKHFCTGMLVLSSRMVLIRTEVTSTNWTQVLTNMVKGTPDSCPLEIKWRPSQQGGRPWSQPELTSKQLRAVKAQALVRLQGRAPGSESRDLDTCVQIQGPLGPNPDTLLRTVMESVSRSMAFTLREVDAPFPNNMGEWAILHKPGTDIPNGSIRLRVGCVEDAKRIEQIVQGSLVVIGGRRVGVQVTNPVLLGGPKN